MMAFSLTNGAKQMITLPTRDNVRLMISCNNNLGLALDEADAVGTSGRYFTLSTKLNDHPVIIDPPLLMNGESLWFFEPTGGATVIVTVWVLAGA